MITNYAERARALLAGLPEWPGGDDMPTIMAAQAFAAVAQAEVMASAEAIDLPEVSMADRRDAILTAANWLQSSGYSTAARMLHRNIDDMLAQP